MDERLRFVARVEEGESVTELCREFGISRKTGQKFLQRYRDGGLDGLKDQSRAPMRIPHKTAPELVALILDAKRAHPTWGPKKLHAWLRTKNEGLAIPGVSTIGWWLQRNGLVKKRPRRPKQGPFVPVPLTTATAANQVWCADFKGQFQLLDGRYCYPLTITDLHSRYLIACTALESTRVSPALWAFEQVFEEFGLPEVIRTDNGVPFACTGLAGLTALSARWARLGIRHERTEPAHPEQNGQHERMHLTLKEETTRPPSPNMLQQQERFDAFQEEFNVERPHEALEMRPPASSYEASSRKHPRDLSPLSYPLHDLTLHVMSNGSVRLQKSVVHLTGALAGERVGAREVDAGRWLLTYATLDLGVWCERDRTFTPMTEVSPMCPVSSSTALPVTGVSPMCPVSSSAPVVLP